ncbi:MAG: hypothetical protein HQM08_29855 [Candidatus Riflebacteria bacterium]|nr:hypothetical protein [Candidatus Riflebacteria bacterium]
MKKMHFFRKKFFLSALLGLIFKVSAIFAKEILPEIKNLWIFSVGVAGMGKFNYFLIISVANVTG